MRYYYIKLRDNIEREIKVLLFPVNLTLELNRKLYRELTAAQREFYIANPTATVQEVVNCQLTPPYVPPTPDVRDYAAQRVKELKDACLATVSVTPMEYAMANAVLAGTSLVYSGDRHYNTTQAKAVMTKFMDESHAAMTVFETYKTQMEAAQSVEAVDTLYNQAIEAL